jgi:hypothetical protein
MSLREPEDATRLPALADPLREGARVRSLRNTVPGLPMLEGYEGLYGTVCVDPDHPERGTGNGLVVVVRFDDDPGVYWLQPESGYTADDLIWVWPRSELEVV